jgi:hypothetical protein
MKANVGFAVGDRVWVVGADMDSGAGCGATVEEIGTNPDYPGRILVRYDRVLTRRDERYGRDWVQPERLLPAVTPEERLRAVARVALRYTEVARRHNGRGRTKTYAADADAVADTARQLAEMVLAYLDGHLYSEPPTEGPF